MLAKPAELAGGDECFALQDPENRNNSNLIENYSQLQAKNLGHEAYFGVNEISKMTLHQCGADHDVILIQHGVRRYIDCASTIRSYLQRGPVRLRGGRE